MDPNDEWLRRTHSMTMPTSFWSACSRLRQDPPPAFLPRVCKYGIRGKPINPQLKKMTWSALQFAACAKRTMEKPVWPDY